MGREVVEASEPQAEKPVRLAIVGAGYWGNKVIREVVSLARTSRLVALHSVVDNSPTALERCSTEFGLLDFQLDYRNLLSDPTLDAVYIASPNQTHYEVASAFIRHGKHVLVEKPLALTSKEAYDLVELARLEDVVLSVGHIHRFNGAVNELRRAIATGVLGEVYYIRLRWTGYLLPQRDRDVISDLTPHPFDILNALLAQWPKSISCKGRGYRNRETEEVAFITIEFEGGVSAHIEVSWLDREKHRDVTVVGSNGIATIDCSDQEGVLVLSDRTERVPIVPVNSLAAQIIHFSECVRSKSLSRPVKNLCPGTLGAHIVRLSEAARESLRENKTVPVLLDQVDAFSASGKDRAMLELLWEPPRELRSRPLWDPSSIDPDYSMSTTETTTPSVEARIRISRHRTNILLAMNSSDLSPKELASKVGLHLSNLGKYINDLAYQGLVERKTPPDIRKGRIYGLTKKGLELSKRIVQDEGTVGT